MKIYDEIIQKTEYLLSGHEPSAYQFTPERSALEGKKNQLILGRETAFELGAGTLESVNFVAITENEALVPRDEILVYGNDLTKIKNDCSFARITFLRTDFIEENGDQGAYSIIKNIEMKKFDVSPDGYMMRASALSNREQVRISKTALKAGLSFEKVGNLFIKKYRENRHVKAVKLLFVTLPDAPYGELDKLATSAVEITRALNHIIADLNMDCHACSWKPVCDEVEGMKEMHFKMAEHK